MRFDTKFQQALALQKTFLCVGIDPDPQLLPARFSHDAEGVYRFVQEVLEATAPVAAAFKFNLAFFEIWGWQGWQILYRLITEVPQGLLTIGDAKRGDIGNSARFYARALFETLGFDAATVSPYLGSDSIQPFITNEDHGAFVLCVTSNPSGAEIQHFGDLEPLYLNVACRMNQLSVHHNLGLVMGATKPEQLATVRGLFPDLPFLIPGIGKQGGEETQALAVCRSNGRGLINVSRAVLFPDGDSSPAGIATAARQYAQRFKTGE